MSVKDSSEWSDYENELGRVERLVAYIRVQTSKTGQKREIPCNEGHAFRRFYNYQVAYLRKRGLDLRVTPDTLIFGNPEKQFFPYRYSTFSSSWWKMMKALEGELKGHKFSSRPYTIYSMRSTFIENSLLGGMDIFLLSRICGHSVDMLQRHYERIDVKERAQEITKIDYGKKKRQVVTVDLFDS